MHHDFPLVSTIAVGLSVAFVLGLFASKLRLSPIVGYLLAGIIIGPYTPGFVGNTPIAEELSEIGIVLLMFGVGMHFSIESLLEVKRIAIIGALVQITAATVLGVVASSYWGWSLPAGLMLGLALSVASTVVLLRALETHNLVQTTNGQIAIGWLVVEDLVTILALVMIPLFVEFSSQPELPLMEIAGKVTGSIAKIGFFIICMLFAGKRIFPWLLTMVARTRSRELFTLAVFSLAVGIAFGAAKLFGVSLALGAFFAGMMIRKSSMHHEVAERALPFQDAFAVLFFISVGMLFQPSIVVEKPFEVLTVVAIIMVGKSIFAWLIVVLLRYPFSTSVFVSAGLSQIGEFSFILANLGKVYNIFPEEGHSLIIAGALISIMLNPMMFHAAKWMNEYALRSSKLSRMFNVIRDEVAALSREQKRAIQDHVILVGYGRVGKYIAQNILFMDLVVVELNREKVESLRKDDILAIAGDATHADALRKAGIVKALSIIIAVPNPFEAMRIAEVARSLNPEISIITRARNNEEIEYFKGQKFDLTVIEAEEVGRRMLEYLSGIKKA